MLGNKPMRANQMGNVISNVERGGFKGEGQIIPLGVTSCELCLQNSREGRMKKKFGSYLI